MIKIKTKILIVKPPYAGLIVDGLKCMEIRGSNTNFRGLALIAESGTNAIIGSCIVTNAAMMYKAAYETYPDWHQVNVPYEKLPYTVPYWWHLEHPQRFPEPIPYKHPQGAVIWVKEPLKVIDPIYHSRIIKLTEIAAERSSE